MDDETWAIRYMRWQRALVAGQEGTVFTRVDSKGKLGGFQGRCRLYRDAIQTAPLFVIPCRSIVSMKTGSTVTMAPPLLGARRGT